MQGLDYAYTLQGWLKGINPTMGGSLTNGTDTTEAKPIAQDVFGFSLHYYKSDYKAIWYTPQASSVLGALTTNAAPLYNGNIAAMAVNIPKLSNTKVYNYKYDQLNRLVAMDMYNGLNPVAGTFTASSSTEYRERISYDPNGNIGTYQRNGDAARLTMDNLTYSYTPNTNRLHKVVDAAADASAGVYPNYNDLRTGQADNNYVYDAIGNLVQDVKDTITNISWNVYGKIESITKNAAVIRYTYDASGNRISKATAADTTFYVRDASGNVLSVYSKPAGGTIAQEEVHLYGSSRLGITTRHLAPDTSFNAAGDFGKILGVKFTRGEKLFELSNHLGNVLVTLADRVVQVKVTSDTVRHYLADVRSANDYYPFGMLMSGRKFNSGGFRYGFNGKENDNEVKGTGNQQDYGERTYDLRLGRFFSIDPLARSFPWYTPYQYAGNNPILFIDIDGLEPITPQQFTKTVAWLGANKPMYLGNFRRIHYELFTKRVYYGEGSLNKSEQNILRGAVGEVVFAGRATIGYLPYFSTMYSFNKAQSATSTMRHDVKLTLTPIALQHKLGEKGVHVPGGGKVTWGSVIPFADADGSTYNYIADKKSQTTLYVEVKTLGINSFNFTNLVDGFDQAIRTAGILKGQKNSLSVLAVDAGAYMNAVKDPAQAGILIEKLNELRAAGGHMMLVNNQASKTDKEIESAAQKAKEDANDN